MFNAGASLLPEQSVGPARLLVGAGMILGSQTTSNPGYVLGFGVLAGAGIGFGYVCPIAAAVKWFPDKKGMVTGIAVAGFGFVEVFDPFLQLAVLADAERREA